MSTRLNIWVRSLGDAERISFWIRKMRRATIATSASEADKATVVTVVTVEVVTVDIMFFLSLVLY